MSKPTSSPSPETPPRPAKRADCQSPPRKILLLISNLEYGGAQRQVIELANQFNATGLEAHVCCLSDYVPLKATLDQADTRLHVVAKKHKFDISVVPRLRRLIDQLNVDLVHAFLFDAEIAARLAGGLSGRVAVIGSERNTDYTRKWTHTAALKLTANRFDAIIANSHAGKRFQARSLGIADERLFVVHNGVDTDRFAPLDASHIRQEIGVAANTKIVGMFCSFKVQKNHAMYFRAARRILDAGLDVVFLCVGGALHGGLQGSNDYHARMNALLDELNLRDHVRLLGNRDDIVDLYNACDVTTLTSSREGTPNVLLESMACRVPVVATDVADNAIVAPDGRVGYIVNYDNDEALADRLKTLLTDAALRNTMATAAREWVQSEFSLDALRQKTLAVYHTVLQRRNTTRSTPAIPKSDTTVSPDVPVRLMKYPHPYKSMLALCSDLDETPDRNVYLEIARFLNTSDHTSMGQGVNLEVGNTIFFDMPSNQFSYRTTDDAGREIVHALIHSGHIDCLHSYGDVATTRDHAKRALDDLTSNDCRLKVWIDHSKAPSNFGPDIMVGRGDLKDDPVYHADLTLAYGVRYVWRGRTTVVTGQNAPANIAALAHILDPRHPIASAQTMTKETVKVALGRMNHPRWDMYAVNDLLRPSTLRDDQPVWEFLRSHPHWGGAAIGADALGVADVLTRRTLDRLVKRQAVCVWYAHLGKYADPKRPFNPACEAAFRRLADYRDARVILVTTTYRLLRYLTVRDHLCYDFTHESDTLTISLKSIDDPVTGPIIPTPDELQGISFETCKHPKVVLQDHSGSRLPTERFDFDDRAIVTVPWTPLSFPL